MALVMGNVIPPIGVKLYTYFERDYAKCCFAVFIFALFVAGLFFVFFYLFPYSDNTQEAIEKRKKLLEKEKGEAEMDDAKKA